MNNFIRKDFASLRPVAVSIGFLPQKAFSIISKQPLHLCCTVLPLLALLTCVSGIAQTQKQAAISDTSAALLNLTEAQTLLANATFHPSSALSKRKALQEIVAAEDALKKVGASAPNSGSNTVLPNDPTAPGILALLTSARDHVTLANNFPSPRVAFTTIRFIDSATHHIQSAINPRLISIEPDSQGVQRFMVNGKQFNPICVNDLDGSTRRYKTFDMFDTTTFNLKAVDDKLQAISAAGFNCVRLWLKGYDTDDGFAATPGGKFDEQVFQKYLHNVDATLNAARSHDLRVILTGSFPGPKWPDNMLFMPSNYLPPADTLPSFDTVAGINRLVLIPAMATGLGRFYMDLLNGLIQIDPQVQDNLFYFDLYNEIHYDLMAPPFAKMSGTYMYQGITFDMSKPQSRQALMDTATKQFIATLAASVKDVMPGLPVAASEGYNSTSNHKGIDGGIPHKKPDSYMLRSAYLLAGGADILDIHTYAGPAIPQFNLPAFHERASGALASLEVMPYQKQPTSATVSSRDAPLFAGEFGAEMSHYGIPNGSDNPNVKTLYMPRLLEAITELKATEQTFFCAYGFAGFAFWDWGTRDGRPSSTFNLHSRFDPDDLANHAFSPAENPKYCGLLIH
jgi:hypothetical protein